MGARNLKSIQADLDDVTELFNDRSRERGIERAYFEYLHVLKLVDRVIGLDRVGEVVDLGAGAGVVAMTLARRGASVIAMDNWTEYSAGDDNQMGLSVDIIKRLESAGVTPVVGDITSPLPFADRSKDLVLILAVIEHLHRSPAGLLTEVHRILRPGGHVVLTSPNAANLENRLRLLLGRSTMFPIEIWYYKEPFTGHVREFTMSELSKMLTFSGFEILETEFTEAPRRNTPLPNGKWLRGLRMRRPSHLVRVGYHAMVTLLPRMRYACMLVGRRPLTASPTVP